MDASMEAVQANTVAIQRSRLVSVVIIDHNYERYLRTCIDSVLAQTHEAIEIVVVDDGSTDGSSEVLAGYGDRIRVVHQANVGHVLAYNVGFEASQGEIVLFLDADDLLYPDCVAAIVAIWRPDLAKVQFRLDTIDADGKDLNMPFPSYPPSLSPSEVRKRAHQSGYYPWPVSSGNAYARDYLRRVMPVPFPRIWKSPDGYANKLAPLFGDVESLPRRLGAYRVHGKNGWAQSAATLQSSSYGRMVRFDRDLHEEFVAVASRHNVQVGTYETRFVPQWIEVRLLSLRLCPEQHPIADDHLGPVVWLGLRAAAFSPALAARGRILWLTWFVVLALAPARSLPFLLRSNRTQGQRGLFARVVIRLSRQSA
jgi:glycosyltransferase involved in cell wall biosynthesis